MEESELKPRLQLPGREWCWLEEMVMDLLAPGFVSSHPNHPKK